MEVVEKDGKYLVGFDTKQEAELHVAALKEAAKHESLSDKVRNLVERLGHHGIGDADKPLAKAAGETQLSVSHPDATPIAAPEDQATPGPVITLQKPVEIEPPAPAEGTAASAEAK